MRFAMSAWDRRVSRHSLSLQAVQSFWGRLCISDRLDWSRHRSIQTEAARSVEHESLRICSYLFIGAGSTVQTHMVGCAVWRINAVYIPLRAKRQVLSWTVPSTCDTALLEAR